MTVTRRLFDARGNAIADTRRIYRDSQQPDISDRLHWITADDPPQFVAERIVVEMTDGTREIWIRGPEDCPLCEQHYEDEPCPYAVAFVDVADALLRFIVITMNVADCREEERDAAPLSWWNFDEIEIHVDMTGDQPPMGTLVNVATAHDVAARGGEA